MKAISYSLFGFGKQKNDGCFSFDSYIRGFFMNLRMNRLMYPEWKTILNVDQSTYNEFSKVFELLQGEGICEIETNPDAQLCMAMLWRLKPIFTRNWSEEYQGHTDWTYTHVICRDLDSIVTYKEVQAVQTWVNNDKAVHAITDSDSHSIPMMGGMIGLRPHYITERLGVKTFNELMNKYPMDLSIKGSDQTWLNQYIYPMVAGHGNDSITQHYFEGMPKTYLSDYHTCTCARGTGHNDNCPNNIKLDISEDLKDSNSCTGHIGASGYYPHVCMNLFRKYKDRFEDIFKIEATIPEICYWTKDDTFK